jgi:hypothetical protein
MRLPEFQNIFRLARRPGEGVFCDVDGLSVGEVALLERAPDSRGAQPWRPRPAAELNRDLSRCYGLPIEIEPKAGGLKSVADALDRGDLAHAQMVALHLRLPDPPDMAKSAGDVQAFINLARRLDASGLLKREWDANLHPRWPAGSEDSTGGQFAPRDSQGNGGAASESRNAGAQSGSHLTQAQITMPAPGAFPAPFDIPMPAFPNLPSEIVPPPIIGPGIAPRNAPQNPYPNRPECVEEWAHAHAYCNDLLRRKVLGKGDYRNMGKFLAQCLMGQVSEECGGNALRA